MLVFLWGRRINRPIPEVHPLGSFTTAQFLKYLIPTIPTANKKPRSKAGFFELIDT